MSSPHSSWEGPLGIPLQSVEGHKASSRVEFGTSGFLFSSDMDLVVPMSFSRGVRPRLMGRHGTQLLSQRVKDVSGFLSSGHRVLGFFLQVPRGYHPSLRVMSRSSGFQSSPCRAIRLIWCGSELNRGFLN